MSFELPPPKSGNNSNEKRNASSEATCSNGEVAMSMPKIEDDGNAGSTPKKLDS